MPGSSVEFFADNEDLLALLVGLSELNEIKFTQTLSELNETPIEIHNAVEILSYSVSEGKPIPTDVFLVTQSRQQVNSREITMSDGSGVKTKTDQIDNPKAIEILLGGEAGEGTLIASVHRTTGETPESRKLFSSMKKVIHKKSKRIKSFYVMKNAEKKLDEGWRLTQGIDFSVETDLKR